MVYWINPFNYVKDGFLIGPVKDNCCNYRKLSEDTVIKEWIRTYSSLFTVFENSIIYRIEYRI